MTPQFVVVINERTYRVERPWGTLPAGQALEYVSMVAVDSGGDVYIAQRIDPPILVFSSDGDYLRGWGSGVIADAHGISISADDRVLVVDRDAHQVLVFDTEGELLLALGERDRPALQTPFNHPTATAVSPDGRLYVSDGYANAAVHVYSPKGELLETWGSPGSGRGEFMTPHAVAIDPAGRVLVADRDNDRVLIFDASGEQLDEWSDFFHPMDIHVDSEGLIHVTDQVPRLSSFTVDGALVGRCRPVPYMPHGISGDAAGNLYLVEPSPTDQITKLSPERT